MKRYRLFLIIAAGLVAITCATLIVYNKRLDKDLKSQLFIPRDTIMSGEIALLQQYIRIDTQNPPGNEIRGAQFLGAQLAKYGIHYEIIESAPGRASIYARIKGKNPGSGLLLLHHIDVVPATNKGWTRPPFTGTIFLNQLYGRGALDMKSIGICQLLAFIDVAKSHRIPEHDLVLLGVADEETGGSLGTAWLLAHRPDIFEGIAYALNEGGITETQKEKLSYFGIELGSKMAMKVRVRASSRDAILRARIALEPSIGSDVPERVLPEVKAFLQDIAPQRLEQRALLEDVDRTIAEGKFWLLQRGYRELTRNIVWPGGPVEDHGSWTMDVHMFNLPDEQPDARLAWLRQTVAPSGATIDTVISSMGPAPISSRNTPMYRLIEQQVKSVYGDVPVGSEILAASFNDSRYLRAHGIAAYGMWPFRVDFFQSQGIHGTDERIRTDWFQQGVTLMRRLVSTYSYS